MSETEAYMLNAVQTPTALRAVYESIGRGNTTTGELKADTELSDDLLGQGLTGLRIVGLIGRREPDYYTVELPWQTGDEDLDFRMGILHNVAQAATPGDWGKQSVLLLNYQYLLDENVQVFENDDKVVFSAMDELAERRGYRPYSQQGVITMNEVKFVNWSRFANYLGLVHKASGRTHTTYPDEQLIRHSAELAVDEAGNDTRVGLEEYVKWLNENLLLVSLTSDRNVPAPLSRVLSNLVRDGHVRVVESGDAGAVGLNRIPTREGIDSNANAIEVVV
jgi:hypothetical protein